MFFCLLFFFFIRFSLPQLHKRLHQKTKTLNPSNILPLSMPSYSIRLHGPLLCPLPRPRLKEKRQKEHLEGVEITVKKTRATSSRWTTATEEDLRSRAVIFTLNLKLDTFPLQSVLLVVDKTSHKKDSMRTVELENTCKVFVIIKRLNVYNILFVMRHHCRPIIKRWWILIVCRFRMNATICDELLNVTGQCHVS